LTDEKKVIVITGASSGIGRQVAVEMAPDGHSFYLIGRNEERLREVKSAVEDLGGKAVIGIGDVSKESNVDKHFNQIHKSLGRVDVLIANAGVGYFGNLEDLTIEEYDKQFDTNVRGVFLYLKKALQGMKKRNSGQIIVTSSNLGLETSARASIYAATKHAVQAIVWSLREELKGTNVKAATINPGSVSTPWFDGKDVDRSKMLTADDVAKAFRAIIDQHETSNIDHIHIMPNR
jgi:3-oxoacyl-[acyl-carrier protein] reductase